MTDLPRSSETVELIAAALSKAQGGITAPKKSKTADVKISESKGGGRYSYSYADLADVLHAIRKPLADNGLAVTQDVINDEQSIRVATTVLHESGQWLRFGPMAFPGDRDPQRAASAISYARRYALTAALGVAAEDDDAVRAEVEVANVDATDGGTTADVSGKHTEAQMKMIHALGKDKGRTHEQLTDWAGANLGTESLKELTKAGAKRLIDKLVVLPDVEQPVAVDEPVEAEPDPTSTPSSGSSEPAVAGRDAKAENIERPIVDEDQAALPVEPVDESGDDQPATKAAWKEAVDFVGTKAKVVTAYKAAYNVEGTVTAAAITNAELRHVLDLVAKARATTALSKPETPAETEAPT